jgi:SAM-dependent MidA family methyltransferase
MATPLTEQLIPLEAEIRRRIEVAGPMPVAQYMALCLTHPEHGYYVTRDPLGAAGDFVTAPEVSQMFGELIGLWAATAWKRMGAPENVRLVELGPGRGTMMADALRAAKVMPDFRKAVVVHMVEVSPVLEALQKTCSPTSSSTRCRCTRR